MDISRQSLEKTDAQMSDFFFPPPKMMQFSLFSQLMQEHVEIKFLCHCGSDKSCPVVKTVMIPFCCQDFHSVNTAQYKMRSPTPGA